MDSNLCEKLIKITQKIIELDIDNFFLEPVDELGKNNK